MAVQVRDLERSLAFYRDVLGLRVWGTGKPDREVARPGRHSSRSRSASVSFTTPLDLASPGTRGGPGTQADLDLAEHLPKNQGLPCRRRREDSGDGIGTRDPDRTHLLLVWLDDVQLAGNRLPRVCTRTSEPDLADGRPDRAQPRAAVIARPCGRRRTEVRRRPVRQLDAPAAGCRVPRKTIMHRPQRRAAADAFPESARRC